MKQETFYLTNDGVLDNVLARIRRIPLDGKVKVVLSSVSGKRARQRGLQWMWYEDVAMSGIGGEHWDTKDGVHLISKYRFAVPILCRDDDMFAWLYGEWCKKHGTDKQAMLWFVDEHVTTEKFTSNQMAEYLTNFHDYFTSHGVQLRNPEDHKLLQQGNRNARKAKTD